MLPTGRIVQGPDLASNMAGRGGHAFNGAVFGVILAVLVGGFASHQRGGTGPATLVGAGYGPLLGTGFLISPVPKAVGAGFFGADFGARFAVTVYLAHALFGAVTGLAVHPPARRSDPLWQEALPHRADRPNSTAGTARITAYPRPWGPGECRPPAPHA